MDMCATLPVIIHHECGDPSAHSYLLDCLRQAIRCNENTVLLGSTNWKSLLPEGVAFADARALKNPAWQNLNGSMWIWPPTTPIPLSSSGACS